MTPARIPIKSTHPLDLAVALLVRRSKLFSRGWGDEALLEHLLASDYYAAQPPPINIQWDAPHDRRGTLCSDGTFVSPLHLLPQETRTVHLRSLTRPGNTAACVMLAASRDESYYAREHVFGQLPGRGLDLYFLMSPFYGPRRMPGGTAHITISDHGLMALGIVMESRALLDQLRSRYAKLAMAGYSMGGHMAAITTAVTPYPVACAALATGASASSIYTRGLLSWSVDLDALGGGPIHRSAARDRLRYLFSVVDITHYPPPLRPDAAIIAGCKRDGYILRSETERLHQYWKGSELRWIPAGHFSALMTCRRALCDCVAQAVEKL